MFQDLYRPMAAPVSERLAYLMMHWTCCNFGKIICNYARTINGVEEVYFQFAHYWLVKSKVNRLSPLLSSPLLSSPLLSSPLLSR